MNSGVRVVLDSNEAEVLRTILTVLFDGKIADLGPGDWGVARSLLHRLNRAFEPVYVEVEEGE